MSTSIKTCPGCRSLILSDTSECPECGTVFDAVIAEANAAARASLEMKTQNMYDDCKKCGSSVRSGLVRCWNCNSFMRKDVENKYDELMSSPQRIIFSEEENRERDEVIPARVTSQGQEVYDAVGDDDGFELGENVASRQATPPEPLVADDNDSDESAEFELDDSIAPSAAQASAAVSQPAAQPVPPAQPNPTAEAAQPPAQKASTEQTPAESASAQQPAAEPTSEAAAPEKKTDAGDGDKNLDDDDFVGLALSEAKETHKRKRRKVQEARRRRVLVPCTTCGAWIRIFQDQAGRTVRCQKCKTPFVVPQLRKKAKSAESDSPSSQVAIDWIDDVRLHVVNPTDIVLKPGSLEKASEDADVTFHDGCMHIVRFAAPAKKSLFGKSDGPPEIPEQRKQVRDAVGRAGGVKSVPVGELYSLDSAVASKIRLVQPVSEAHASMFAGVPVFGAGRIAIYLPVALPENQQLFLSMSLSESRVIAAALLQNLEVDLQLADNGVPMAEQKDMLKCKLLEIPVESIRNVEYYENDPAFELEMTGYRCGTCQVVISEDGRAKKKLGGANGKGIAKAKCPGCSSKMGDQKTYRISKAPGDAESEDA